MPEWMTIFLPILLVGAGYLARRVIERKRSVETLIRKSHVVALYWTMKREGLSVVKLKELDEQLSDRE